MNGKLNKWDMEERKENEIKRLLKENLAHSREIKKMVKSIRRYILFSQIRSVIWWLAVIVSLVAAYLYLPPFLRKIYQNYQNIWQLFLKQ